MRRADQTWLVSVWLPWRWLSSAALSLPIGRAVEPNLCFRVPPGWPDPPRGWRPTPDWDRIPRGPSLRQAGTFWSVRVR